MYFTVEMLKVIFHEMSKIKWAVKVFGEGHSRRHIVIPRNIESTQANAKNKM